MANRAVQCFSSICIYLSVSHLFYIAISTVMLLCGFVSIGYARATAKEGRHGIFQNLAASKPRFLLR